MRDTIEVPVKTLKKLRAAIERHNYYQTEDEKGRSFAALLGFLDGLLDGLLSQETPKNIKE